MIIYKGFVKVSKDGTFYPISRITSLSPAMSNPLATRVEFDNGDFIICEHPMLKTIDIINKNKGENND